MCPPASFESATYRWSTLLSIRKNPLLKASELALFAIPILSEGVLIIREHFPDTGGSLLPRHISASLSLVFYQSALVAAGNIIVDTVCPGIIAAYRSRDNYEVSILQFIERRMRLRQVAAQVDDEAIIAGVAEVNEAAVKRGVTEGLTAEWQKLLALAIRDSLKGVDGENRQMEDKLGELGDWEGLDRRRPSVRFFITLLYAAAALLFLYNSFYSDVKSVLSAA